MKAKTFSQVTTLSMLFTLTAALLSLVGITITGLYPAIPILCFIAMIPIASRWFAKKINGRSDRYKARFYTTFMFINSILILVVLWMSFVIVHDRVLKDCC